VAPDADRWGSGLSPTPDISVIVPTRERRASLERALRALARQGLAPDRFEVVVAVDGSEDGTREAVARFPTRFALRSVETGGRGRAAACNAAARAARGNLLVLLDDDMEPSAGFLAAHRDAHGRGPRRGVVGAVPIRVEASTPPVVAYVGRKFNGHLERLARPDYRMTFRDFYSGNFSIPRSLFFDAGAFDEGFQAYGNEDGELALRLLARGVELVYSGDALADQHYEKDFAALARDTIAKGETAVLLSRKWPEARPHLGFARSRGNTWKWRFARSALLALSRLGTWVPRAVVRATERLERRRSPRLDVAYRFALDYFYHLGARRALASPGRPAVSLPTERTIGLQT
jgi:GT2 family glycosyltransferase